MIIGRTSVGRVAATKNQLAFLRSMLKQLATVEQWGVRGKGRGETTYWEPLCRSGGLNGVFGENGLFEWLEECDRGA